MLEDLSSTKPHVVFDTSAEKVGPSLNDAVHKEPCLAPPLFDALAKF